VVRLK